jgi:hypothetical protein
VKCMFAAERCSFSKCQELQTFLFANKDQLRTRKVLNKSHVNHHLRRICLFILQWTSSRLNIQRPRLVWRSDSPHHGQTFGSALSSLTLNDQTGQWWLLQGQQVPWEHTRNGVAMLSTIERSETSTVLISATIEYVLVSRKLSLNPISCPATSIVNRTLD